MSSNPKLKDNYITLVRCAALLSFFLVSIMISTTEAAFWVPGQGRPCYEACSIAHRPAVTSDAYTRNGRYYFVCTGNAQGEGYRAGYNLDPNWNHSCTVGWGGTELSLDDYQCLCEGRPD
jgi:hypothetical protein